MHAWVCALRLVHSPFISLFNMLTQHSHYYIWWYPFSSWMRLLCVQQIKLLLAYHAERFAVHVQQWVSCFDHLHPWIVEIFLFLSLYYCSLYPEKDCSYLVISIKCVLLLHFINSNDMCMDPPCHMLKRKLNQKSHDIWMMLEDLVNCSRSQNYCKLCWDCDMLNETPVTMHTQTQHAMITHRLIPVHIWALYKCKGTCRPRQASFCWP